GVGGAYNYNDHLQLRAELNFFQTSYEARSEGYFNGDIKTLVDRQSAVNVPVMIAYTDNAGKYRPYGYLGASISRLLRDRGSISLLKVEGEGDEIDILPVQSPDFDFTKRRTTLNKAVIFGGGVKYKFGLDFLFAEARYSIG